MHLLNIWQKVALIGVGGILAGEQAVAKQQAGADLVQIYATIYTDLISLKIVSKQ